MSNACKKVEHLGEGYLHDKDWDGPYDVDGVSYCGRCHGYLVHGTQHYEEKPIVSRMSSTCAWLKDGTKIVFKRNKDGACWLEVENQAIIYANLVS